MKIKNWETPLSGFAAHHIRLSSLVWDENLNLIFKSLRDPHISVCFKFDDCPAFRTINEDYCIGYFDSDSWEEPDEPVIGPACIVAESAWINSLADEPLFPEHYPEIIHYMFLTADEVLEVLSSGPPEIQIL